MSYRPFYKITMEYKIILKEEENFWQRLSSIGLKPFTKSNGIIYKYVSYKTAVKIIQGNCLHYSISDAFNDPFDLTIDLLDCTIEKDEMIEIINKQFVTDDDHKQALIDHSLSFPDAFTKQFETTFENAKSGIGITCFSKSYMKTLMWSHYAEKHSGICLGFRFSEHIGNDLVQLAVRYTSEIKPVKYIRDSTFGIFNWLFTKSNVWNYEEEVRRIYTDNKGLINFDKSELCEIYYGLKVSQKQINKIQKLLNTNSYQIEKQAKMQINKQTFDLMEVEI